MALQLGCPSVVHDFYGTYPYLIRGTVMTLVTSFQFGFVRGVANSNPPTMCVPPYIQWADTLILPRDKKKE
jgi:hypothetical protein